MRVYYETDQPTLSRAMRRIRAALRAEAPDWIEFVTLPRAADVQVIDVIGWDSLDFVLCPRQVVIQYCIGTTAPGLSWWADVFRKAALVWSYHDLPAIVGRTDFNFVRLPLGVDRAFRPSACQTVKRYGIATSGFVAGDQEAIDCCYLAAAAHGKKTFHLGPWPVGMVPVDPALWDSRFGISDEELAGCYGASEYVSGLRWHEGFELPVIEGMACGARPVCFDLPGYRHWFDGMAVFVPHDRRRLLPALRRVLANPSPPSLAEQLEVRRKFDWKVIASTFWNRVREAVSVKTEV